MKQIALSPKRRRARRLFIDAATEEFYLRQLSKFVIVAGPATFPIADHRFEASDAIDQRQHRDGCTLQLTSKRFWGGNIGRGLNIDWDWSVENLVVAKIIRHWREASAS